VPFSDCGLSRRSDYSANLVAKPYKVSPIPGEKQVCPNLEGTPCDQGVIIAPPTIVADTASMVAMYSDSVSVTTVNRSAICLMTSRPSAPVIRGLTGKVVKTL
jgi:hypothetical protein